MIATENSTAFARIPGNPTAKRAIEVAAVAGASLLIEGPYSSPKNLIAEAYAALYPDRTIIPVSVSDDPRDFCKHFDENISLSDILLLIPALSELRRDMLIYIQELLSKGILVVATMQVCPCGVLNSRKIPCRCTLTAVEEYRGRVPMSVVEAFDMVIQAEEPSTNELTNSLSGLDSGYERLDAVMARCLGRPKLYGTRETAAPEPACSRFAEHCTETLEFYRVDGGKST